MIVALCFIGFIIFSQKSLGNTFKVTLDGRIQAIQEESQQFPNPNEVVSPKSNEQQRLLRISLRICGTIVESLPMAPCAPKCEKIVQALLFPYSFSIYKKSFILFWKDFFPWFLRGKDNESLLSL
ncbi:ATP synthase protein MI25 [Capsicum annuum]|uniref:ATP synthase protein MI25 n=1 Tax=Capsicum annuum TaxID=4072 RepID=A0A2G3AHI7_CAPAN|nr:ATP synthase protein MI25 [Capsicum annuum]